MTTTTTMAQMAFENQRRNNTHQFDQVGDQSQLIEALQDGLSENLKDLEKVVTTLQGALPLLCKNTLNLFQIVAQCEESRHRERQLFMSQIQMLQLQKEQQKHAFAAAASKSNGSQHSGSFTSAHKPKVQQLQTGNNNNNNNVARPLKLASSTASLKQQQKPPTEQRWVNQVGDVGDARAPNDEAEENYECFADIQDENKQKNTLVEETDQSKNKQKKTATPKQLQQPTLKPETQTVNTAPVTLQTKSTQQTQQRSTQKKSQATAVAAQSSSTSWMVKKQRVTKDNPVIIKQSNTRSQQQQQQQAAANPNSTPSLRKRSFTEEDLEREIQQNIERNKLKAGAANTNVGDKSPNNTKQRSTDADDVEMKTGDESPGENINLKPVSVSKQQKQYQEMKHQLQTTMEDPILQLNAEDLFVQRPSGVFTADGQVGANSQGPGAEDKMISQPSLSKQGFVSRLKHSQLLKKQMEGFSDNDDDLDLLIQQQPAAQKSKTSKNLVSHHHSSSISKKQQRSNQSDEDSTKDKQTSNNQSKQNREYKFREVVRDQKERQALKGQSCFRCKTFYEAVGLEEDEDMCNQCSRHRDNEPIQNTPENFYDLDV